MSSPICTHVYGISRGRAPRTSRREGQHDVQQRADDEHGHAERDQPASRAPGPVGGSRTASRRLGDHRLLGLEELDELDRPLDPRPVASYSRSMRRARVEQRERLLAAEPAEEAAGRCPAGRTRRRAGGGACRASRASSGRPTMLGDSFSWCAADRLEDVDRELRVRVLASVARVGPGAALGRPRPVGRRRRTGTPGGRGSAAGGRPRRRSRAPARASASARVTASSISPRNSSQL